MKNTWQNLKNILNAQDKNLVILRQLCLLDLHIESFQRLVELIYLKYKCYKELPEEKEFWGIMTYGFGGVCIQSGAYHGDGSELLKANICSNDILVNKNRITFK